MVRAAGLLLLLLLLVLLLVARRLDPARGVPAGYTEVAEAVGLRFETRCGSAEKSAITEFQGAGLAWIDHDGDGDLDLFVVGGFTREGDRLLPAPNALFRNDGSAGFRDVTAASGLARLRPGARGYGCAVGDYDGDGRPDLYVSAVGPDSLFRNEGPPAAGGTWFRDVSVEAGLPEEEAWGSSAAFLDADRDGDLDLYVAQYLVPRLPPGQVRVHDPTWRGIQVPESGPNHWFPEHDRFLVNEAGRYLDRSREAGVRSGAGRYGLGVVVDDVDGDGWPDVFVANDAEPNFLFRNRGAEAPPCFEDVALRLGVAYAPDGKARSGMGTDARDYDHDGDVDLVVTNLAFEPVSIYRREGPLYTERSQEMGVARVTFTPLGWGVRFEDLDCDGHPDLFVVHGHLYPEADTLPDEGYRQPPVLLRNTGDGRFEDVTAGWGPDLALPLAGRAAAFADFDDDGDVDVAVTQNNGRLLFFRNDRWPRGHAVLVALEGTRSNRSGIGAVVRVTAGGRTQRRFATPSGSYLASNDPRLHFGLGEVAVLDRLEVAWPSGARDVVEHLPADAIVTVREGEGVVGRRPFGSPSQTLTGNRRR